MLYRDDSRSESSHFLGTRCSLTLAHLDYMSLRPTLVSCNFGMASCGTLVHVAIMTTCTHLVRERFANVSGKRSWNPQGGKARMPWDVLRGHPFRLPGASHVDVRLPLLQALSREAPCLKDRRVPSVDRSVLVRDLSRLFEPERFGYALDSGWESIEG